MLLVAPLTWLPFAVAGRIFSGMLWLMALSLIPLFGRGLGIPWGWDAKFIATVVLFASFPLAEALYVQQFAVLVIFLIAAGCAALSAGRLRIPSRPQAALRRQKPDAVCRD